MKRTVYSASDLRERTDQELKGMEKTLRQDLFKLRMGRATNQLENVSKLSKARRDLARVLTILKARADGLEPTKQDTREA
jgi:large subunit ribosomal protein L29